MFVNLNRWFTLLLTYYVLKTERSTLYPFLSLKKRRYYVNLIIARIRVYTKNPKSSFDTEECNKIKRNIVLTINFQLKINITYERSSKKRNCM